jgi:hypothetical protein
MDPASSSTVSGLNSDDETGTLERIGVDVLLELGI